MRTTVKLIKSGHNADYKYPEKNNTYMSRNLIQQLWPSFLNDSDSCAIHVFVHGYLEPWQLGSLAIVFLTNDVSCLVAC